LLGHWKNFDELESSLSLEELTAVLDASRKKDYEDKKFSAALQGVELDEEQEVNDIADLKGYAASQEGFGIGQGLGFMSMGDDE
jgi:hypothetical protein